MRPRHPLGGRLLAATACLALAAVLGCSDQGKAGSVDAATLAGELTACPDLIGESGSNAVISVRNGTTVVVRPGEGASVQEVERQLGVALTNLAEKHGADDLGFVSVGDGWEVLGTREEEGTKK